MILVFVILGNSASGGPFARPLLPGVWRTIGGVLPPGASVDLSRSALFFDGARIAGPILVLVGWAVLGTALSLALGGRDTVLDPAVTAVNGDDGNVNTLVEGTYGSVIIDAAGNYGYLLDDGDPDTQALAQGETATDVFGYTMTDGTEAVVAELTITLTGSNDAPVRVIVSSAIVQAVDHRVAEHVGRRP